MVANLTDGQCGFCGDLTRVTAASVSRGRAGLTICLVCARAAVETLAAQESASTSCGCVPGRECGVHLAQGWL